MAGKSSSQAKKDAPKDDIQELRSRLEEAEATLAAIRSGTVDALVGENNQIFTLKSADFSYRILVESMNQGAVTLSDDGTILYCNNFFGRMVKLPMEQVIGTVITRFVKPDELASFNELLYKKVKNQKHEFQFLAVDKSVIPVYVAVKPLKLGLPQVVSGMIVTDLTETKHNEAVAAAEKLAMQRLVHEHESAQKAKELEFVRKQRKDLIASNKAKDEFISIASHQLRTPATAVKQYLGMIREGYAGRVPKSLQLFLETAYDSNEQQLSIIDELLKIAQIDSGSFRLKKKRVDLGQLAKDVVAQNLTVVRLRRQKLITDATGDTSAYVDPQEISLALSNLIENASKYSPAGKSIIVAVRGYAKHVEVRISDKGVGIAKSDINKIFDKFTRIDNALSDTVTGTGLGLYWVKRIVKMHKGSISVQSEPHKGSTFTMTIPI